ncbi:MAG: recombinase family protein, partial [Anaerolineae bacterium]|nr:recombinase family protein [Anaerolineae bacterium]
MSLLTELNKAFEAIAVNGAIGDPSGKPAYAYMRVSTPEQAEEGRSGIPRQVQHIHEVAKQKGYRIAWDQVFMDDDSGYEFRTRTGLTALRREYMGGKPKARAVVMEHLDRLSRNADWHQGFLLDEMKQYGIEPVFWKAFSSRIERAVMGAIAQDGMEQSKQRMIEGTRMKAQNGRVTAKTRTYGYKFVDSNGKEGIQALKDTHYALLEQEAWVVKHIFDAIAYSDKTIRAVAIGLEGKYPPPKRYKHWDPGMIRRIIRNPVYKGEFVASRFIDRKILQQDNEGNMKMVRERIERPPEEWIAVPFPAIVDAQTWEVANQRLDKNKQTSSRNAKNKYLLTGLVKCATCGYAMAIKSNHAMRQKKQYHYAAYICSGSKNRIPARVKEIGCDQLSHVLCHVLEDAVWSAICTVLLNPEVVIGS